MRNVFTSHGSLMSRLVARTVSKRQQGLATMWCHGYGDDSTYEAGARRNSPSRSLGRTLAIRDAASLSNRRTLEPLCAAVLAAASRIADG